MLASRLTVPLLAALVVGCAPGGPGGTGIQQGDGAGPTRPKTAVLSITEDPKNFWDMINGGGGSGAREVGHLVNQYLVNLGPDGNPVPRLLAELPALDRGTWKVLPDGKMETTYKLRPDAVWHDGTPFTADDVAFSWEVGRDRAIPNGNAATVRLIERIEAVDDKTALLHWGATYPFADRLEHREFYPLPKHILDRAYRESKETLIAQPHFSSEWVGLGPYRLVRWEQGSHMDLTAFDRYFLGRAKIDTLRVQFIPDDGTLLANLRAGTVNAFLPPGGPGFDEMMALKREWETNSGGQVLTESIRWTFAEAQKFQNPQPRDLADAKVRQALLHAINRPDLVSTLYADATTVADSWVHPSFAYYSKVEPVLTKYPFDQRRASTLLEEVGWRRGASGTLEKGGDRFNVIIRYRDNEKEANILRDAWKSLGIDAELEFLPDNLLRDAQARASYTGFDISNNPVGGLSAVRRFISEAIPTQANRFAGTNRGGYSSPAWDEIGARMRVTLEDDERLNQERDLVRIFTTELPALPLFYEIQTIPVTAGLVGLQPVRGTAHTGNIMHTYNVHEWDIQRR